MRRLILTAMALILAVSVTSPVLAQEPAEIRVVHASPDAPAVDVLVNGDVAFDGLAFKGITDYASLTPAAYNVQVVPAGVSEPVVIEADLALDAITDYTVVAVGRLDNIEPLVLVDDNRPPAAGKAHVRFVHASPDAPAVDIAVQGGPVLFNNIAFKETGSYLPVDAGTYDLEVRLVGTETVALEIPGVRLQDGAVYTVFAMGLVEGEPTLQAVPTVDFLMPGMPQTGGANMSWLYAGLLAMAGIVLLATGLTLRRALVPARITRRNSPDHS
jgi:hypothetical protein